MHPSLKSEFSHLMKNPRKVKFNQYTFDNHSNDEIDNEFLEKTAPLIGFIIQEFNALEELVDSTINEAICSRTDIIGSIVICKMGYTNKVNLLNRLMIEFYVTMNETKKTDSFKKVYQDLATCAKLRNTVIHASWEECDVEGFTYTRLASSNEGLKQEYQKFTLDSLEKIRVQIHETYMKLSEFSESNPLVD